MVLKAREYPNGDLRVATEWLTRNLESKDLAIIYEVSHIRGALKPEYGNWIKGPGTELKNAPAAFESKTDQFYNSGPHSGPHYQGMWFDSSRVQWTRD